MAIDTAEKRRSLSGIQHTLMPGLTVNVAKDQEWRQESGWSYSGILATGAAAEVRVVMIGSRVLLQRYTVVGATQNIRQMHGTTLVRR
jgi:hypothetical protein